ncbi:MAG: hypothetical protein HQL27_06985 [Candidatus Omnitrophica bacterium]|nr:hypothetical protein [Candidatus Omnitrophota bacterium]
MRQIAKEYGIDVIDLNAFLASRHEDGFIWRDFVHMSSFGYKLTAD